jgi:hypothetical protein
MTVASSPHRNLGGHGKTGFSGDFFRIAVGVRIFFMTRILPLRKSTCRKPRLQAFRAAVVSGSRQRDQGRSRRLENAGARS